MMYELNFIRSANAPVTIAGVMMANMHWKIMNAWCGTASVCGPASVALTFANPKKDRSPTKLPTPGPNANV